MSYHDRVSETSEQVPLDYRPRPRGEGPAWMRLDKFAELAVGLAWTACGCALLIVALGWMFFFLDPKNVPWRAFVAVSVAVDTLGIALAVLAFALRASKDGLLLGVLVVALVMAALAYGGAYELAVRGHAASPGLRVPRPSLPTPPTNPPDADADPQGP